MYFGQNFRNIFGEIEEYFGNLTSHLIVEVELSTDDEQSGQGEGGPESTLELADRLYLRQHDVRLLGAAVQWQVQEH